MPDALLALGNDPGSNFNITLDPTFQILGIGKFCISYLNLPADIKDGTNATIQIATNGDPNGGLYNCVDITFSSSAKSGDCTNGTGISSAPLEGGKTLNANATDEEDQHHGDEGSSSGIASSGTTSVTAGAASQSKSSAAMSELSHAGGLGGTTVGWMSAILVITGVVGGGMILL